MDICFETDSVTPPRYRLPESLFLQVESSRMNLVLSRIMSICLKKEACRGVNSRITDPYTSKEFC